MTPRHFNFSHDPSTVDIAEESITSSTLATGRSCRLVAENLLDLNGLGLRL